MAQDGVTATNSESIKPGESSTIAARSANLHRLLKVSQVQLYGIGAAIGSDVFVSTGSYLPNGGLEGLFRGSQSWCTVGHAVNQCCREMVCYATASAPFLRFAAEWDDEALGFALSWVFFFDHAILSASQKIPSAAYEPTSLPASPSNRPPLKRSIGSWDANWRIARRSHRLHRPRSLQPSRLQLGQALRRRRILPLPRQSLPHHPHLSVHLRRHAGQETLARPLRILVLAELPGRLRTASSPAPPGHPSATSPA